MRRLPHVGGYQDERLQSPSRSARARHLSGYLIGAGALGVVVALVADALNSLAVAGYWLPLEAIGEKGTTRRPTRPNRRDRR